MWRAIKKINQSHKISLSFHKLSKSSAVKTTAEFKKLLQVRKKVRQTLQQETGNRQE